MHYKHALTQGQCEANESHADTPEAGYMSFSFMTHALRFLLYNLICVCERHRQVFWILYIKPDQLPRAPWQMSVLVAPPRMNCGSSQSSCGEEEIRGAEVSDDPKVSVPVLSLQIQTHLLYSMLSGKLICRNNNDPSELKHPRGVWVESYVVWLSVADESLWSVCVLVCDFKKSVNSCNEGRGRLG